MPAGWVREWLRRAGVNFREGNRDGTAWYRLEDCPFHPGEGAGDCGVGEATDGRGLGHCFTTAARARAGAISATRSAPAAAAHHDHRVGTPS